MIKQIKAEVIATKCLQHQSFNVLKRNIIHSNVYTINKISDVNNLSHNEEHLHVSKIHQNVSIKRKYGQNKMNPGTLGRQDQTNLQHKQDKTFITYFYHY